MLENSLKNTDAHFRAFQRFWVKKGKRVALQKSNWSFTKTYII